MRKLIEQFWTEEHEKNGYDFVYTPHIGKSQLWETSGHLGFYKDNMYAPLDIEGQQYFIKPMNCPSTCIFIKIHCALTASCPCGMRRRVRFTVMSAVVCCMV